MLCALPCSLFVTARAAFVLPMNFCACFCGCLKHPLSLKVLAVPHPRAARVLRQLTAAQVLMFLCIFWSMFNIVLSASHTAISATGCPNGGCKVDAKTLCSTVSNGDGGGGGGGGGGGANIVRPPPPPPPHFIRSIFNSALC
jgi:hypothetical protein